MKSLVTAAAVAAILSGASAVAADAGSIDGRWDAVLTSPNGGGTPIPFRVDLSGSGSNLKGTLYDGFHPYDGTTSASFKDGQLVLDIEHYLTTIKAGLQPNGELDGTVTTVGLDMSKNSDSSQHFAFHAVRHVDAPAVAASNVPNIAGSWVVPLATTSAKGEKAFRLIVEQHGTEAGASILRVDGDSGEYTGSFKDGKWVLSHFDGSRPGVITLVPNADGTVEVKQGDGRPRPARAQPVVAKADDGAYSGRPVVAEEVPVGFKQIAYRADVALAKGLPQPDDYEKHTTAKDPKAKFTFAFPDDHGKLVSSEDPRFKGKAVLAIVTGTWCPNCHDEAQYLVELDKKYRNKGLAIVALDFEEPDQADTLEREHAFVKQYGVKYTYLIAGSPAQMWEKVPQLNNLNTWPATLFIGRDGTVRSVHSGFASPASGEFNTQLKTEFESKIQSLLAEKLPVQVAQAN